MTRRPFTHAFKAADGVPADLQPHVQAYIVPRANEAQHPPGTKVRRGTCSRCDGRVLFDATTRAHYPTAPLVCLDCALGQGLPSQPQP